MENRSSALPRLRSRTGALRMLGAHSARAEPRTCSFGLHAAGPSPARSPKEPAVRGGALGSLGARPKHSPPPESTHWMKWKRMRACPPLQTCVTLSAPAADPRESQGNPGSSARWRQAELGNLGLRCWPLYRRKDCKLSLAGRGHPTPPFKNSRRSL